MIDQFATVGPALHRPRTATAADPTDASRNPRTAEKGVSNENDDKVRLGDHFCRTVLGGWLRRVLVGKSR